MRLYRVIVIMETGNSTCMVTLDRPPDPNSELHLPHGEAVRVRHVVTADDDSVHGVVIADPGS